jgi:hypothetical protein
VWRRPDSQPPYSTEDERWFHKIIRFLAYLASLVGGAGG